MIKCTIALLRFYRRKVVRWKNRDLNLLQCPNSFFNVKVDVTNETVHEDVEGKLSDNSIFSTGTGSPPSPHSTHSYQDPFKPNQEDPTQHRIKNPNGFPRKTSMEKKTRYTTLESADLSTVESADATREQLAAGTTSMEEDEQDGWISEEVCPWEDE